MKLVLLAVAALATTSCVKPEKTGEGNKSVGKLEVSATFNAMKEIAQAVGGELVQAESIIPDGVEPHDFEPKGRDIARLAKARVLVRNGLGLEGWADELVKASGNSKLIVVDASAGAIAIVDGGVDPHLWLSPSGAELQARNIQAAFAKADPAHAKTYSDNADAFVAGLRDMSAACAAGIRGAKRKEIVTGHAAFAYLCRDFGIAQYSVEDMFASGEPSPRQLADLAKLAKEKGVKTVFAEGLASTEVSKTLAAEVGASVRTIYTMEAAEDGKSYLERMKSNLEAISASLGE